MATDAPTDASTPNRWRPAVTRAALILDVLAETAGEPVGPSELARRLALPKSSIANICGALADAGLVRRVGTGFALGRRLAELGGAYLATVDQVQEFYEASRQLEAGSEETVQFAVLDGLEMTYLARHDGRQPVRLTSGIGRRLPASSTATGKAALASLDDPRARPPVRGRDQPADAVGAIAPDRRRADGRPRRGAPAGLRDRRRGDDGRRRLLRRHGPEPPAGRRAVRRQHHPAQGSRDRRAGGDAPGRPPPARSAAGRSAAQRRGTDRRPDRPEGPGTPGVAVSRGARR